MTLYQTMLEAEPSGSVRAAVIAAIDEVGPVDLLELVLPFVTDLHVDVRHITSVALAGRRDERAIQALMRLSRDPEPRVRNWATFALGSQLGRPDDDLVDRVDLREALAALLRRGRRGVLHLRVLMVAPRVAPILQMYRPIPM
jgi:HEAT repeat protein